LLQVLLGDLGEPFTEDHDAVPLGLLLALTCRLVAPGLGRRHAQIGNRPAVLGPSYLRILAEISDQDHLVHTSRHRHSPPKSGSANKSCLVRRPYTFEQAAG